MRVYAQQGDTVDLLCWRYLGSTTGLVEKTLERNPGLAQLGLVLPHGTPVDLPEVSTTTNAAAAATVQLWD
ncbi:tail protein X [Xanthomonas translucens]|uniref:tail protein X n=1 Tax=Xanthomonas campestris pv. translucens TaxID=343 RepID=UPI0021B70D53|nr:tail protein X [Xanthomonas translucens]MCT8273348.1 tail protein X [Xanthomonas translucens pv. translucens]MCT8277508.1 tail protein X [Xanthomonas translucens pv. translucens]MCT8306299.1 tail protein X [Xanthomonas translucens pv. translucens]WNJ27805.1 tail protein X [Xanthomonas translucens pv. translucens]